MSQSRKKCKCNYYLLVKANSVKCASTVLTDCQVLKGNGLSGCMTGSIVLDSHTVTVPGGINAAQGC